MIILLSPAKSLDYKTPINIETTSTRLDVHTNELIDIMRNKSSDEIGKLMKLSKKLSDLNYNRFQQYLKKDAVVGEHSKAAIYAFQGDVYKGFDVDTLQKDSVLFAQQHLRILSGLYGLLRPLDAMQPYRLEMGTRLQNPRGKNLYDFWDSFIADTINDDLKSIDATFVLNLASKEYFEAVQVAKLSVPVVNVHFKEYRDGLLRIVSFYAKKARGLMARYICTHKIKDIDGIKSFDLENYAFDPDLSTANNLYFTR